MGSLHSDRAFAKARRQGAAAAASRETWDYLMSLSKRELAEVAMHLAAVCTDSYEGALADGGRGAVERIREEVEALKANKII